MSPSPTAHIFLDGQGKAWIDDTNVKVIEVVKDKIGYGFTAEQEHEQYPHLSLAQIHAALSYYYDHKDAFDAEVTRDWQEYEELRAQSMDSPIRQKLRALGKIP
jgi:uncharacterized protein (DUF433 family)